MNQAQLTTVQDVFQRFEKTENLGGRFKLEVNEPSEWEDEGCIEITVWAGGVGTPVLIDEGGDLCDPEEGPGFHVELVVVPDKYSPGRDRFSYISALESASGRKEQR